MRRSDLMRSAGNKLKGGAPWLVLVGLLLEPAAASPLTHCSSTETDFFSCSIVGSKKVVSLCGGGTDAERVTWVQYRFGRISAPEMIYPSKEAKSLELFGGWYESHSGHHSMAEVWFHVGAYSYLIASTTSFEVEGVMVDEPSKENDLVVFKDGRAIRTFNCEEPVNHNLWGLQDHISDDQTRRP
ncbi:MAG: hypothetical protein K0M66_14625 [Thiobacillus sp.]|nr:hypothetical protein [Thiobacillus sp.]